MTCQRGGTWFRLALPILVAALAGFGPLRAQEPAAKEPIPDASSLQQALALVEEVYGGEFNRAKDVVQKTALAERLLQKAKESAADPTSQYALLKVAKDIAALAGDADLALRAVDDMAATFQTETLPAKVETLLKTAQAASQTKQHERIVRRAEPLIELAVQRDDFVTAGDLSQAALSAARKSADSDLVKKTVARGKETDEIASAYAEIEEAIVRLKTDPVDPEANLAVGRYRCLVKGEWERGISYLALGNDPALKELAIRELKGVADTDEQVALGDGWWEVAATSEGLGHEQVQERAAYWYKQALPELSGLVKDKVERRIQQVSVTRAASDAPTLVVAPFDERTAKQHQAAWAKHLKVPLLWTNAIGLRFVLIPAGEFMMGSPYGETDRRDVETQHRVRITKPFYLGVYEVTQREYVRVMGTNPSRFNAVSGQDTARFPVEMVSWEDASEFCRKLSTQRLEKSSGRAYRLPTAAEWEYACRAGTTTPFHFGSQLNGREANCNGNAPYGTTSKGPDLHRPTTVGSYPANAFGLHDMHGNVWEWCSDWYGENVGWALDDPAGPAAGTLRVLRGGTWYNHAGGCRSAHHWHGRSDDRNRYNGFRVACSLAETTGR